MREKQEPRVARWVLEHLVPTQRWSESLSGDLAEQWSRRSRAWYWRQVAGAFVTGWAQEIYRLRLAIVFAALYVFPQPLLWIDSTQVAPFNKFWLWSVMLPWPWPFVAEFCMHLIVFVWTGHAVYLIFAGVLFRAVRFSRAMRGLLTAMWVFVVTQILMLAALSNVNFTPINLQTASDLTLLTAPKALLLSIPTAVAMVCAIRTAMPVESGNRGRVAGV